MSGSLKGRRVGYLLVCISTLLVSVAQLIMKVALTGLPPLGSLSRSDWGELHLWLLLSAGLLCYSSSLIVWYFTLQRLALGKAYALLSLSYVLVWLGALCLPYYHDDFSLMALGGVAAIVAGVLLVCWSCENTA